jgi:ERCC4-type nuclease
LATIEELNDVPGIGQKTAKAIQEVVGSERLDPVTEQIIQGD